MPSDEHQSHMENQMRNDSNSNNIICTFWAITYTFHRKLAQIPVRLLVCAHQCSLLIAYWIKKKILLHSFECRLQSSNLDDPNRLFYFTFEVRRLIQTKIWKFCIVRSVDMFIYFPDSKLCALFCTYFVLVLYEVQLWLILATHWINILWCEPVSIAHMVGQKYTSRFRS